jgi:hypothetical protein
MDVDRNEPWAPGLNLKVSAEQARALMGKWIVVDPDGEVRAVGDDFAQADAAAKAAGLDFAQVEFLCLPPPGLVG